MSANYIFCYSGSGNCLDIAKNIAEKLGDTDIIMMRRKPAITNVYNAKTVGFVFPCYAGGLPGNVEKYVAGLNVGYQTYTYAVVSYAGYPGTGLSAINKIIPLDYWAGVSHNCSCIWLFPHQLMLPIMTPKKAQKRSELLAAGIAEDVNNRVVLDSKVPYNALNAAEYSMWPTLVKKKAKNLNCNSKKCVQCGQCVELCPTGNISILSSGVVFHDKCIGCLSCLQYCPQKAIDIGGVSKKRARYHNPNITASELNKEIIHID